MQRDPETLLVVTSDHETGAFSFSYSRLEKDKETLINGQIYKERYDYGQPEYLKKLALQKKTCVDLMDEFNSLPQAKQTRSISPRW